MPNDRRGGYRQVFVYYSPCKGEKKEINFSVVMKSVSRQTHLFETFENITIDGTVSKIRNS